MTIDKAKEIISYHKYLVDRDTSGLLDKQLEYQAIDMAIKALEKKPCNDAISKASVFEIMGNLMSIPYDFDRPITEKDVSESMDEIRNLPSVTPTKCIATVKFSKEDMQELIDEKMKDIVVERKKGKWIYSGSYDEDGMLFCSNCKHEIDVSEGHFKFCPNCGSFMSKGEKNEH